MKGYWKFILVFVLMLAVYIVAEVNRPKPLSWKVTLSKDDKNPYGAFILYKQLKDLFPEASINSYQQPVYNQVKKYYGGTSAYLLLSNDLKMSKQDVPYLLDYVSTGNYVFISSYKIDEAISDTLKFEVSPPLGGNLRDTTTVNYVNPYLKTPTDYGFRKYTIFDYFTSFDTANTVVLGKNNAGKVNFIRIDFGDGAFFVHAAPLCFSNYFMLTSNNNEYVSKALSYIPKDVETIFWDEYYKREHTQKDHPLRVILDNEFLRNAYYLALMTLVLFVLFEMKRRQRIIPVLKPMKNTTLEFVKTISNLYFEKHNDKNIAEKKINYLLEFIRSKFYLQTNQLNDGFIVTLSKKSGVSLDETKSMVNYIITITESQAVSDRQLVELNKKIDAFYKQVNL